MRRWRCVVQTRPSVGAAEQDVAQRERGNGEMGSLRHYGPNIAVFNAPINRIMMLDLYSGGAYPIYRKPDRERKPDVTQADYGDRSRLLSAFRADFRLQRALRFLEHFQHVISPHPKVPRERAACALSPSARVRAARRRHPRR